MAYGRDQFFGPVAAVFFGAPDFGLRVASRTLRDTADAVDVIKEYPYVS